MTKKNFSTMEKNLSLTEENFSLMASKRSIRESNPIDASPYGSAGSKNTFEARTCSAVSAMSGRVLKQFVVIVRFMVRLIGTEPSTPNTAGSATETQWFSGDPIVAAAVFYGQNRQ
jgi:hypothetical protein